MFASIFAIAIIAVAGLNYLKFEKILSDTQKHIITITAESLKETIVAGLDFGLPLNELSTLQAAIVRSIERDRSIVAVKVADINGTTLIDTRKKLEDDDGFDTIGKATANAVVSEEESIVSLSVQNNFSEPVAILSVIYSKTELLQKFSAIRQELMNTSLLAILISITTVIASFIGLFYGTQHRGKDRRLKMQRPFFLISIVTLICSISFVSITFFTTFDREVRPFVQRQASVLAATMAAPFERAIELGVPLQKIPQISELFDDNLQTYKQVDTIGLQINNSNTILRSMTTSENTNHLSNPNEILRPTVLNHGRVFEAIHPISHSTEIVAWLHVIINTSEMTAFIQDAEWDVLILILVSILIVFEFFKFIFGRLFSNETKTEETISKMPFLVTTSRLPLFLFVSAEQFSTSFNAIHGRNLLGLEYASILSALPLVAFVAAIALTGNLAAGLVSRYGAHRTITLGCLIAASGYFLCSLTSRLDLFVFARSINGIGYALITIALQSCMAVGRDSAEVKANLASFTSAIMLGAVCGTSIGGVFADRLGYNLVYAISGGLVLILPLVSAELAGLKGARTERGPDRSAGATWGTPEFVILLLFCAIPAKIVLNGFIFYLAPLQLKDIGLSQAAIARNIMLYALLMVPAIYLGSFIAKGKIKADKILIFCAAFSAIGLVLSEIDTPIAIGLVGLLQGIASVPMLSKIPEFSSGDKTRETKMFAMLRSAERIGGIIGPLLAASLVVWSGSEATIWLGWIMFFLSICYLFLWLGKLRSQQQWSTGAF